MADKIIIFGQKSIAYVKILSIMVVYVFVVDAVPVDPGAVAEVVSSGAILFLWSFIIEKSVNVPGPRGDLQFEHFVAGEPHEGG